MKRTFFNPRSLPVRIVCVSALVIVCTLACISFYYRQQTQLLLRDALENMATRPKDASDHFSPVLRFNDTLTLGAAGRARDLFREALMNTTLGALQIDPVLPKTYYNAGDAMVTLTEMERASGENFTDDKLMILQAVKDSANRVLARGTISAWQAMQAFYTDNGVVHSTNLATLAPYRKWVESIKKIPLAPLALRDAINGASDDFRHGLSLLKLNGTSADGPLVQIIPQDLSPAILFQANELFQHALNKIEVLRPEFRDAPRSAVLELLVAKLNYNIGAVRVQHRLDGGQGLHRLGSEFIVQSELNNEDNDFPSNEELYDNFMVETVNRFFGASTIGFAHLPADADPSLAAGFELLSQYHATWALELDAMANSPRADVLNLSWREVAQKGRGRELIEAMQAPPRVLIIVQVP